MCTHERYDIPWFELRNVSVDTFKNYRTYLTNNDDYTKTRNERVSYLETIGYDKEIVNNAVPIEYQEISDFIWQDVIKNFLKVLEKEEDVLKSEGITNFAISGHTEGNRYLPWQLFDKSRGGI